MDEDESDNTDFSDNEGSEPMETSDNESVVVTVPRYLRFDSQSSENSQPLIVLVESVNSAPSPVPESDSQAASDQESDSRPPSQSSQSSSVSVAPDNLENAEGVVPVVSESENGTETNASGAESSVEPDESSSKSKKRSLDDSNSDGGADDGMSCPVCLDSYTNSGEHRIVSLKCGHLFGKSCIERWLKAGCAGAAKRCPQCNMKASTKDIRIVYARKLTAMDTAENDRLKKELEKLYSDYKRLELELVKSKINIEMLEKQFLEQQKEIKTKFMVGTGASNNGCIHCNRSQTTVPRLVHTYKLPKGGGRVLAYNKLLSLLIASQASQNPVFQGYGITKINSLDLNITEFMFLHPKAIRDLAFHPHEPNVLLTVSLDKTAKLVDVSCNSIVQTYQVDSPVWSCCWDTQNSNICFVGTQTGSILQFDRRRTDKVVLEFSGHRTPIVSLSSIPAVPGRMISKGGIIACRLSSVWAFERDQMEGYSHRQLPLEGAFISLNFDTELDLILASARPSQQFPTTRHMLYQLAPSDNSALCQHIHTFNGGTTVGSLSKSRLLSVNQDTLVCAFNESSKTVDAFSLASFNKAFSLSSKENESVFDLMPVSVNKSMYLSTLSETFLNVYSIPSK